MARKSFDIKWLRRTPYQVLGVAASCAQEEAKRAYKKAAAANHPDRGGTNANMATVNEAWRILEQERAEFDLWLVLQEVQRLKQENLALRAAVEQVAPLKAAYKKLLVSTLANRRVVRFPSASGSIIRCAFQLVQGGPTYAMVKGKDWDEIHPGIIWVADHIPRKVVAEWHGGRS